MVLNRFLLLGLLFAALLVVGCTQSPPPSFATPTPDVTVLPSVSPVLTVVQPTASGQEPSASPSATPEPSVAVARLPTLVEFAAEFNVATKRAFNDTRAVYESAENVWVVDHTTSGYQYTIFIRPAKARYFGAFDTVRTVHGASGMAKNVSLDEGEKGPYYKYAVVMKCFDAHYDVEMNLLDYTHMAGTSQYRRTLGPDVMLTLVDACPN